MALKKKKGASMITVVITFAVLTTLGVSILSLTASDYQMRIVQSKKVQNLYQSDSGINAVEGAIQKLSERAISEGNAEVTAYLSGSLNEVRNLDGTIDKSRLNDKVNEIFKARFKKFFIEPTDVTTANNINYLGKYEAEIESGSYRQSDDTKINLLNQFSAIPVIEVEWDRSAQFNGDSLVLDVESAFDTPAITGETSNEKSVSANIVINAPNYNGNYALQTKAVEEINPIWKNAISIDGNMELSNNFTVNGEVYVKGNSSDITDRVYSKYNGGISIGEDDDAAISTEINSGIAFNGNVITGSSFNINGKNREVKITGNLFSKNVYLGKSAKNVVGNTENCSLTVVQSLTDAESGAVYTVNDLAMNAESSAINIDKYYGINDITGAGADNAYKSSSSIIINSDDIGKTDGSSIKIDEKAVIMGSAYINTDKPYQTGESVAIKGNYKAYTVPIAEDKLGTDEKKYSEGNIQFVYNDPLQIADSFKVDSDGDNLINLFEKGQYIQIVDRENLIPSLKKNGVTLPDAVTSVGVTVSKGQLSSGSYEPDDEDQINTLQDTFAKTVYEMDNDVKIGVKDGSGKDISDVYDAGNINKTVFEGDDIAEYSLDGIQNNKVRQIKLDNSTYNKNSMENNNIVECISSDKDIVIVGKAANYTPYADEIKISTDANGKLNGIIITSKNIKVYGQVDYNGTIIAGGDFVQEDDKPKTFTANDTYTLQLISRGYENIYKYIFNEEYAVIQDTPILVSASASTAEASLGQTVQKGVVKTNNWRVVR